MRGRRSGIPDGAPGFRRLQHGLGAPHRRDGSGAGAVGGSGLEFRFGLQPVLLVLTVWAPGFFPKFVSAFGNL